MAGIIPEPNITLREHLERLIKEVDKHSGDAMAALRRELDLINKFTTNAELKADKIEVEWRQAANEWRGAMDKLISLYAPLTELKSLEKRVTSLELKESGLAGKIVGIVATVGAVLGIIALLMQFLAKVKLP